MNKILNYLLNINKKLNNFKFLTTKDYFFLILFTIILFKSICIVALIASPNTSVLNLYNFFSFHPVVLLYCAYIFLLFSFGFIFSQRKRLLFYFFLDLILSVIFISDLWYFRGFNNFLSFYLLLEVTNLQNLSASIFSMARIIDLIFIVDIPLFILFFLFNKKAYYNIKINLKAFILVFIIPFGYIAFIYYNWDIKGNSGDRRLLTQAWAPIETISYQSPIGFHISDFYSTLLHKDIKELTPLNIKNIKKWYSEKETESPDNKYKGIFKNKNLIIIQLESFENFIIKRKINNQEISPVLNSLIANSLYFNNINEQVNNGTTSDAELMFNASIYPVRIGSTFFRFPYNTYNSIAKMLSKIGYNDSLVIHPDPGAYWNWMNAYQSFGYHQCLDIKAFNIDEKIGMGISDRSIFQQIGPLIKKYKAPFLVFTITITSHGPFDLPEQFCELKLPNNLIDTKLGGYFQSQHYTDKCINLLLKYLDKNGILENSVLVFYGDHSGVHKYYNDELKNIKAPGEDWWFENSLLTPLIIYSKGFKGETINIHGGEIDIMPTLCYLMGVDEKFYKNTAMGRNLLKTKYDYSIFNKGTYIGKDYGTNFKTHALKAIEIADLIITGNYFKTTFTNQ